ncbi:unnamed protein product [Gongylonema pulchrum]|uniref:Reverse transcriptase n=1 Tax=Gongylonema pulchrum TaxID=637853 RepID=A0A183EX66_9BILA|nr:unnamed protein product [Gongylonema pulchrum]
MLEERALLRVDGEGNVLEVAAKNVQEAQAAAKSYYDKRWNAKTSQFKAGERVLVLAPTQARRCSHPKLAPRFNGPYRILELSDSSALVKQIYGQEEAIGPFEEGS